MATQETVQNVKEALDEAQTECFDTDEFLAWLRLLLDQQESQQQPD